MTTTQEVTLTANESALRDAQAYFDWALRHGSPGDVARGRRFLAEAKAAK